MAEDSKMVGGIVPKTAMGQHLLIDSRIVETAVSGTRPNDRYVEIGAGTGILTQSLLNRGAFVTAYEIDERCADALSKLEPTSHLTVRWEDFLDAPTDDIERAGNKIIGNIPFHISEPLIKKLAFTSFDEAVLLVGENLGKALQAPNASHNDWSIMSMFGRGFFRITNLADVPKTAFDPVPRVNAKLLQLQRLDRVQPSWKNDTVIRAFRGIIEADMRQGTIASALKQISVQPNGKAESTAKKQTDRRSERRGVNQALRGLASDYNASYSTPRQHKNAPGKELLVLVRDALGEKADAILSQPLSGLINFEARDICSAIESIVNKRSKR